MTADMIMGLVQCGAAILTVPSILDCIDKESSAGVHPVGPAYSLTWGMWDMYYWPSLGQWWALAGNVVLCATIGVWLVLILKYRRR